METDINNKTIDTLKIDIFQIHLLYKYFQIKIIEKIQNF